MEAMDWERKAECQLLSEPDRVKWLECRHRWVEKEKVKTSMLKQKARIKWILDGDENSKFFHASIRRKYNKCNFRGITVDGSWVEDPIVVKEFTRPVCSASGPVQPSLGAHDHISHPSATSNPIFDTGCFCLKNEEAVGLEEKFSDEKIWEAIHECASNKAPGPDGFNMRFFKKFWAIIRDDLVQAINWFWLTGEISEGCNSSFITLIPKKKDPVNLNEYRPISLIRSYYKIIAKLLSIRIPKVIPSLVGFEQSAFIRGRNIMDGALIANETFDYLKNNRIKSMVFKVDFEKDFDSLSWDFLDDMMRLMGFGAKWRGWITSCLKTASISSLDNIENLMKLLKCFELSSGLRVNHTKSNLFGVSVDKNDVDFMANLFGCKVGSFPFIYLGLPIGSNMNKAGSWKLVVNKFEKRLADWKARAMSFGRRLTLRAKKTRECEKKFFWGGAGDETKISWVKWDDVIRPWADGGLNFDSLNCKNMALIDKWWWRFFTEPTSLWVNVIKSIYGVSGAFVAGGINSLSCSNSTWSKIVKTGFEIDGLGVDFTNSFSKIIGNGRLTKFWDDTWVKDKALKNIYKRLVRLETNLNVTVADRVKWDGFRCSPNWEWSRVVTGRTIGELEDLETLISNFKMAPEKEDSWNWKLCGSGKFSTKSLTKQIMAKCFPSSSTNIATQRNNLVPIKRVRRGRIPVLFELDKWGVDLNSVICPLCNDAVETVSHALFSCKLVREIWEKVLKWWGIDSTQHNIESILIESSYVPCSNLGEKIWQAMVWTSIYLIWKNRNQKVFKKICWSTPVALNDIQVKSYEWIAKMNKVNNIEWFDWLQNPQLLVL
ncbi:uncharacterized protein [Rutidosis leptorrhynchoides]|uniref:uncharacterized protein n=1 Tax=Rutidosis leptorrhynchoides TaxID=125765 RepID=UPI003A998BFA